MCAVRGGGWSERCSPEIDGEVFERAQHTGPLAVTIGKQNKLFFS